MGHTDPVSRYQSHRMWLYTSLVPGLGRSRWICEFNVSLIYRVSWWSPKATYTQRNLSQKKILCWFVDLSSLDVVWWLSGLKNQSEYPHTQIRPLCIPLHPHPVFPCCGLDNMLTGEMTGGQGYGHKSQVSWVQVCPLVMVKSKSHKPLGLPIHTVRK